MAKSRFNIKGTKDFLVAAVVCAILCLWSIRDGWFPTPKTLKKHPLEIPAAFSVGGVVKEIALRVGDEIHGKVALAVLYDDAFRTKVYEAEAAFNAAKDAKAADTDEKLEALLTARKNLEACTVWNTDILWTGSHGEATLHGEVVSVLARPGDRVESGQPVLLVNPEDTFYLFNKTLSVLMFLGALVSMVFHWVASH
jgi:multidrug resistance efflux pump